jgi:hypothetical protein
MSVFKYSNHDQVLSFGKKQIEENIDNIDKYEDWGSSNALIGFREGVSTVLRLGEIFEKQELFERLNVKLSKMKVDQENFVTSEDSSALSYLDSTRRVQAINLIEAYIESREVYLKRV